MKKSIVFYLAVIPRYREESVRIVTEVLGDSLLLIASSSHLDQTVKSSKSIDFREARMIRFGNFGFLQIGMFKVSILARLTIVDLNPRSLTAWAILLSRFLLRKRTLTWGHLYPQNGPKSITTNFRRIMRRLSSGSILYTYSEAKAAERDLPQKQVFVAPNSLYLAKDISVKQGSDRNWITYVGRLETSKKVDALIEGFAYSKLWESGFNLVIVGDGNCHGDLVKLVLDLKIENYVKFTGWIDDIDELKDIYSRTIYSVSPGYAGLQITQSLGFGVPILISEHEVHSPEIELVETGGAVLLDYSSSEQLGKKLVEYVRFSVPTEKFRKELSSYIREHYSSEAMANGLLEATKKYTDY